MQYLTPSRVLTLQASQASRAIPASELRPPRPRPQASAAVANRLIGHALGTRAVRNKVGAVPLFQAAAGLAQLMLDKDAGDRGCATSAAGSGC